MPLTTHITIPATGRELDIPTGLFINNEFVTSVDLDESIQFALIVLPSIMKLIIMIALSTQQRKRPFVLLSEVISMKYTRAVL